MGELNFNSGIAACVCIGLFVLSGIWGTLRRGSTAAKLINTISAISYIFLVFVQSMNIAGYVVDPKNVGKNIQDPGRKNEDETAKKYEEIKYNLLILKYEGDRFVERLGEFSALILKKHVAQAKAIRSIVKTVDMPKLDIVKTPDIKDVNFGIGISKGQFNKWASGQLNKIAEKLKKEAERLAKEALNLLKKVF